MRPYILPLPYNKREELVLDFGCCAGELTAEEAAAKEVESRSLGNRIWAFFGAGTEADGSAAGSEDQTSSDAVEETIPFEDPAVVQRDDHRAFPAETQLLLESIKQESLLQVLNPQQQKYLASVMRRDVLPASTTIAEQGSDPVLMWCSSGEFDVTQAVSHHNWIAYRGLRNATRPCEFPV